MKGILMVLVAGIILASCASQNEVSPSAKNMNAMVITGSWIGNYKCGQGITGVTLELIGSASGLVEGTFLFYPTPSNPNAATGRFIVRGTYFTDGSLVLGGGAWIERPDNYVAVSLHGKVDPINGRFSGVVPDWGCSTFTVTKLLQ